MNYIKSQEGNKNIPNVKFYVNNTIYIMRTILHTANKENLEPIIRCYHIFDFLFWEWKSELLPRLPADVAQSDDIVNLVRLQHICFTNSSHGPVQKVAYFGHIMGRERFRLLQTIRRETFERREYLDEEEYFYYSSSRVHCRVLN